jgi:DNA-binding SARP family transcriptional activator
MGGRMRFNVLGTLEVTADSGHRIHIPRPRARQVLTVLLLMNSRAVSADYLAEAVWGEDAPSSWLGNLRTHVHLLRQNRPVAERLRREDGGYLLEVGPGEVDLVDFRTLAAQGRQAARAGDLCRAERLLRQAVALWRSPDLHDAPGTPAVMAETTRLTSERLSANEQLIDVVLCQGRHREVVPELEVSVYVNPLNERAWEQLILALYGSGRRAEAIQAYNGARTLLVDEYGIDPGPRLRHLFHQVLRDDPALVTSGSAA